MLVKDTNFFFFISGLTESKEENISHNKLKINKYESALKTYKKELIEK